MAVGPTDLTAYGSPVSFDWELEKDLIIGGGYTLDPGSPGAGSGGYTVGLQPGPGVMPIGPGPPPPLGQLPTGGGVTAGSNAPTPSGELLDSDDPENESGQYAIDGDGLSDAEIIALGSGGSATAAILAYVVGRNRKVARRRQRKLTEAEQAVFNRRGELPEDEIEDRLMQLQDPQLAEWMGERDFMFGWRSAILDFYFNRELADQNPGWATENDPHPGQYAGNVPPHPNAADAEMIRAWLTELPTQAWDDDGGPGDQPRERKLSDAVAAAAADRIIAVDPENPDKLCFVCKEVMPCRCRPDDDDQPRERKLSDAIAAWAARAILNDEGDHRPALTPAEVFDDEYWFEDDRAREILEGAWGDERDEVHDEGIVAWAIENWGVSQDAVQWWDDDEPPGGLRVMVFNDADGNEVGRVVEEQILTVDNRPITVDIDDAKTAGWGAWGVAEDEWTTQVAAVMRDMRGILTHDEARKIVRAGGTVWLEGEGGRDYGGPHYPVEDPDDLESYLEAAPSYQAKGQGTWGGPTLLEDGTNQGTASPDQLAAWRAEYPDWEPDQRLLAEAELARAVRAGPSIPHHLFPPEGEPPEAAMEDDDYMDRIRDATLAQTDDAWDDSILTTIQHRYDVEDAASWADTEGSSPGITVFDANGEVIRVFDANEADQLRDRASEGFDEAEGEIHEQLIDAIARFEVAQDDIAADAHTSYTWGPEDDAFVYEDGGFTPLQARILAGLEPGEPGSRPPPKSSPRAGSVDDPIRTEWRGFGRQRSAARRAAQARQLDFTGGRAEVFSRHRHPTWRAAHSKRFGRTRYRGGQLVFSSKRNARSAAGQVRGQRAIINDRISVARVRTVPIKGGFRNYIRWVPIRRRV